MLTAPTAVTADELRVSRIHARTFFRKRAILDFLIEGASAAGNKDAEKKLRDAKKLKDAVENGKDTLDNLRKVIAALQNHT